MAFRYDGCLQSIHHVDDYDVVSDIGGPFPGVPPAEGDPHYLHTLGPPATSETIHSSHHAASVCLGEHLEVVVAPRLHCRRGDAETSRGSVDRTRRLICLDHRPKAAHRARVDLRATRLVYGLVRQLVPLRD